MWIELNMESKKKAVKRTKAANKNNVRREIQLLRSHKRRTVVWPAVLIVNEFEFKCTLYDISLGGVRIKLDLPLATGAQVKIKIKNLDFIDALVSWHAEAFVGLRFTDDVEVVKGILGDHAHNLD